MAKNVCPFCGAEGRPEYIPGFMCGSVALFRSKDCYERQLNEILLKDRGKTNEINILTKENNALTAWAREAAEYTKGVIPFSGQFQEMRETLLTQARDLGLLD